MYQISITIFNLYPSSPCFAFGWVINFVIYSSFFALWPLSRCLVGLRTPGGRAISLTFIFPDGKLSVLMKAHGFWGWPHIFGQILSQRIRHGRFKLKGWRWRFSWRVKEETGGRTGEGEVEGGGSIVRDPLVLFTFGRLISKDLLLHNVSSNGFLNISLLEFKSSICILLRFFYFSRY